MKQRNAGGQRGVGGARMVVEVDLVRTLESKVDRANDQLAELSARFAGLQERVAGDAKALEARVSKLEGSPARALAWIGAGFGAIGCLSSALAAGVMTLSALAGAIVFMVTR